MSCAAAVPTATACRAGRAARWAWSALAASILVAAGCGGAAPADGPADADGPLAAPPAATLAPPSIERGPSPPPAAAAMPVDGPNATFAGVTLRWPEGLAEGASASTAPASAGDPAAAPPATRFRLDGYADDAAPFDATVTVYRLGEGGPDLTDAVASLGAILAERPAAPKVPMPATPASRLFTAQLAYLDGDGYAGVRFVTQLAQDIQPIHNRDLLYAFEGLSDDGTRWIQARLPIDAASDAVLPGPNVVDYAAFAERFDAYLADATAAVDALPPDAFLPSLAALDAVVAGLALR